VASTITLKPGRERSLLRHHPWVFTGAVARVEGAPAAGETVALVSHEGRLLARGAYSPRSEIAARVWTFDPDEPVDPAFFRARLARAVELRASLHSLRETTAHRIVHAESDGLPGLVVDRYADWLVCQFTSAGAERWKHVLVPELRALVPCAGIYERSDAAAREQEGLPPRTGLLHGDEPPDLIEIREGAQRFLVDVRRGQKTGFYLDQRESRALLAGHCRGAEVLNGFAYSGSFGVVALAAGAARVTNVDTSGEALELARRNVELNGLDAERLEAVEGSAFEVLRRWRDAGRTFDVVVLDPPRFVESRAGLERAARGYKDVNWLAFRLLRPGGVLFTFSCSGRLEPALFQKIVADAALDARREAAVLRRLGQAEDHPTLLSFPEGSYLKGLVCRVSS
jgi:23S rRNA (cytosine1962-C5)-methyltransferase